MKDENGEPKIDHEYLVTDHCFWQLVSPENYNPLDPNRKPHFIELVDAKTGSVVHLESGSTVKIVRAYKTP